MRSPTGEFETMQDDGRERIKEDKYRGGNAVTMTRTTTSANRMARSTATRRARRTAA